ncbi:pilus assembly protein TadG-related protein [Alkalicoccus halolimnae]|uniref:Pilus assembly protein TadG-related protein n=1 Tax=Alkalicoccus halolimnae TaxID=1667239 RepID=A0AAJ8LWW7_9BACI|nr:pilus assembly protein TadG-related protein [Alkalicoccus halolimnae]
MKNLLWKGQSGNVAIMTAITMAVLIGIAAMALDGGKLYFEKSQMQKAVDAAALAGAQVYYTEDGPVPEAMEVAGLNGFSIDSGSVSVEDTSVTVTHMSDVSLMFARVLGFQTAEVQATATAGIFPLSKSIKAAPIAVEEGSIPDGTYLNCENPGNGSKDTNLNKFFSGSTSEAYEDAFRQGYEDGYIDGYDRESKASLPESTDAEKGYKDGYNVGYEEGGDVADDPGNKGNCGYLAIEGSGASNLYDAFVDGVERDLSDYVSEDPESPDSNVSEDTEPGKKHGRVKAAVEELISRDSGSPDCNSPDTADNSCSRVIIVAVVAEGSFSTISGRDSLEIIGFASYWLEGMGKGQDKHRIIGHFIDMVTLGEGEEGIPEHGAFNVRLIN